jgi:DNA-binding CsgD family transcriptional regulator
MEFWTVPNFHRHEGYNEALRPFELHHMVWVDYREAGDRVGGYPIWRSPDQRPFSYDDLAFLEESAPYIAHGLKTAQLLEARAGVVLPSGGFAVSNLWGTGVMLYDLEGKLIAMDDEAKAIFAFTRSPNGELYGAFEERINSAVDYVRRTVSETFRCMGNGAKAPAVLVFADGTGVSLRIRSTLLSDRDGRDYVAVLVERGECMETRRRRIASRWGLSPREVEILAYMATGKTNREIGMILGTSHRTVSKQAERILLELGAETRTAAAAIFHEAIAGPL